jgi:hypothetical protein
LILTYLHRISGLQAWHWTNTERGWVYWFNSYSANRVGSQFGTATNPARSDNIMRQPKIRRYIHMHLASRSRAFLAGAACLVVTQILFAQPTAKRPLATVSGRVTIKGKPAAGITVGVRRTEVTGVFDITARGVSDLDGVYRITNVPAGSYEVIASAPSFISADLQSTGRSRNILVNEGENIEGVDFALVRGGVITGRVTDADARPVVQQQVNIYRADSWDQRGTAQIYPTGGGLTDDRGIYRSFGLIPGRYKIAVGRAEDTFNPAQVPGRATYKRFFHPDTTDPAKATVIEVTSGSEATGVDITLEKPVDTYSISGRLVDGEKGQPVPGLRVALERLGERYQTYSGFGLANAQGEFTFDGVSPGKYSFSLITEAGSEQMIESPSVEVIEGNVSGLILRITKGASVSGVVAIENETPQAIAKLREVEVRGYVTPASGRGGRSSVATLSADGAFRVGGLPGGTLGFFLSGGRNSPNVFKNFQVARVERDGVPQSSNRFEIKDGEQVTGVRVVVTYGDSVLRGFIKVENGKLPADARFAVRLVRIGEPNWTPVGMVNVDTRGRFVLDGIPAGTYDVIANVQSADRQFRKSVKEQVSLTAGATTEITLVIDASPPKSP